MLPKNVLYYGKEDPLPERTELRAGPLRLIYEEGDLRYISMGSREIVRRIYIAIRDRNWGTILPVYSNFQMDIAEDSFRITYDVENKRGEIDFAWKGSITGDPDGTLTFTMDGEARSTFMKNRIGFCVLHPASASGAPCEVEHVDGTSSRAELPVYIVPDQPVPPFAEMRTLTYQVEPGLWARVEFSGDIFEMEDQRNWTDASYKIFCTPLRILYPVEIQAGTRIKQTIRISLVNEPVTSGTEAEDGHGQSPAGLALTTIPEAGAPAAALPTLGLSAASHAQPLTGKEIQRLRALHLDHLRVDLHLEGAGFSETLARAAAEANQLGVGLDVALWVPEDAGPQMAALVEQVKALAPPVRTWLVYPAKEKFLGGSPTREVVELARQHLDGLVPGAKFASGTNTDLIFMQRNMPPLDKIDQAAFAIIGEVHAFDNTSMIETLEAQAQAVATARYRANGLPVMVSPITFKMRFNPYATGPAPELKPGEMPPQVEVRQMSLFGAGWTLGSIAWLAQAGSASLTYFETTGWRGVMETESGSPLPAVFRSYPGGVYPMYHVFASVGEFAGGKVVPTKSSDPMTISGLVLEKDGRRRVLVANHTPETQRVSLPAFGKQAALHRLDETTAQQAMCEPEAFRSRAGETVTASNGAFQVDLLPYGVAWID